MQEFVHKQRPEDCLGRPDSIEGALHTSALASDASDWSLLLKKLTIQCTNKPQTLGFSANCLTQVALPFLCLSWCRELYGPN